jgi:DNA-directed RNA polymerase subunit RPC12/RpoP
MSTSRCNANLRSSTIGSADLGPGTSNYPPPEVRRTVSVAPDERSFVMAKGDPYDLTLTCPHCGKPFPEPWKVIKDDPELTCPNCGQGIQIRGGAALKKESEYPLAGFRHALKKLSKGRS